MKTITNQNGFTYIAVLTVVIIMGIMLGMVGQTWKSINQRELEEEMIFRGDQVAEIVYQRLLCMTNPATTTNVNQFLWTVNSPGGTILDELVAGREDRCFNGPSRKYRLRPSAALDPTTNKPWKIISPVGDVTRFAGVASTSNGEPFRKSFKDIYDSALLDDKKQYSDWSFTWELKKTVPLSQPRTQR